MRFIPIKSLPAHENKHSSSSKSTESAPFPFASHHHQDYDSIKTSSHLKQEKEFAVSKYVQNKQKYKEQLEKCFIQQGLDQQPSTSEKSTDSKLSEDLKFEKALQKAERMVKKELHSRENWRTEALYRKQLEKAFTTQGLDRSFDHGGKMKKSESTLLTEGLQRAETCVRKELEREAIAHWKSQTTPQTLHQEGRKNTWEKPQMAERNLKREMESKCQRESKQQISLGRRAKTHQDIWAKLETDLIQLRLAELGERRKEKDHVTEKHDRKSNLDKI